MEKRKLSALPRPEATAEMVEMADRLDGMEHIVTAELVDDNKILLLNFYEVSKLKKGKTEAAFRTFLSSDDYITQDLSCLLYTSDAADEEDSVDLGGRRII